MKWIIRPDAIREAEEAEAFYESRRPGLGIDLFIELERGYRIIRDAPERWAMFRADARRFLLDRFPYAIVYTIQGDTVFIIAVAHLSRDPAYWAPRMP